MCDWPEPETETETETAVQTWLVQTTMPTVVFVNSFARFADDVMDAVTERGWAAVKVVEGEAPPSDTIAAIGGEDSAALFSQMPNVQLLQVPYTGVDWLDPSGIPSGCTVANVHGMETPIAEFVLTGMLESVTGFSKMDADYKADAVFRTPFPPAHWNDGQPVPFHRELAGSTVGIIGYGHIGAAVAKRSLAFDMRVIGTARRARDGAAPDGLDWLGTSEDIPKLLAESDFVVVACPLTLETEGLIDQAALATMKPDAVLINVGRGAVCDEAALFDALSTGQIGGAVLDVWWNQPSADDPRVPGWKDEAHPFHELPNVFITPHSSGWTQAGTERRRIEEIAKNLDALVSGAPLINVVATGGGAKL